MELDVSGDGVKIDFSKLAGITLRHTDLFLIGDAHHRATKLQEFIFDRKNVAACAEAGATHMMVELGADQGWILDAYFKNGSFDDVVKAMYKREEFKWSIPIDEETFLKTLQLPEMQPYMKPALDKFERYKNAYIEGLQVHPVDSETERDKDTIDESKLSEDELVKRLADRLMLDGELYKNIRQALPEGEKAVAVYGSAHGSRMNDGLDDSLGLPAIKITVYRDAADYFEDLINYDDLNRRVDRALPGNDLTFGEDPPHAIYIMDTGTAYFTAKSSADFMLDVQKAGTSAPPLENQPELPELLTPAAPSGPQGPKR